MTENNNNKMRSVSIIASLLTLALLCFSMGNTNMIHASMFAERSTQFLCFGRRGLGDVVKLNSGELNGPFLLGLNRFRRFSFTVQRDLNRARCFTRGVDNTEQGDVDLFMCREPDGDECIADPDFDSVTPTSDEQITTSLGARTWYVIVKANVSPVTFTIQCDERNII